MCAYTILAEGWWGTTQRSEEKKQMRDDYVFCYECEECHNCPDAQRKDGCEYGLKTITDEDEENN